MSVESEFEKRSRDADEESAGDQASSARISEGELDSAGQ